MTSLTRIVPFNTVIARIKLGRTLLAERRYQEAAEESLAGQSDLGRSEN